MSRELLPSSTCKLGYVGAANFHYFPLRNTAFHLVRDLTVAWLYILRGVRLEPSWLGNMASPPGWSQYYHCCDSLCCMRRYTCLLWPVGWNRWMWCILRQECLKQPVQPFKGTYAEVVFRMYQNGGSGLAANPSPLPKSMNAVATGNSGLPRSWQGKLLTIAAVFMVETPRSPKLVNAKH